MRINATVSTRLSEFIHSINANCIYKMQLQLFSVFLSASVDEPESGNKEVSNKEFTNLGVPEFLDEK